MKKVLLILGIIVIICGAGITFYKVTTSKNNYAIFAAKLTTDNQDKTSFAKIYNKGKVKTTTFKDKKFKKAIVVDPNIFVNHTNEINNSLYNTINTKLLNKDEKLNSNPVYTEIVKYVAKHSNHMIAFLNLFDIDGEYYAFLKYNAGLSSDEGKLYRYKDNKLTKICTLDSDQIIGLRKVKN